MKKLSLSALLLVLLLSPQRHVEAKGGFVRTKGLHFVLHGNPFFANGFNAYWLTYVASDPSQRYKVSNAFREASSHGLSVARTWAFNDGGSTALQYSPGSYNEQMFKGLDFVVSEARKYKIRLILSLVNNYDSFGGKKQYVQWARNQGQNIASDDGFFTNPTVKGFYKNHVKTVLTRVNTITGVAYKNDPTIFAWELMNEPRCQSDPSGRTIQAWIMEMAAFVKSTDSNHLLEVGLEGFYGASSKQQQFNTGFQVGTDFISNNQIPGIDFATVHSYPDQWLSNSNDQAQLAFLNTWLDSHIQDARNILRKPLLLTEFGKSWKDPGFSSSQRDALFNTVFSKIYWSARTGGATAGGLFWQLLTEGMDSFRDGYEIILNETPSTAKMIAAHCRRLHYLVKLYARMRDIEQLEKAKAMRRKQQHDANKGKNGGN
ncbi:mannan endo-1,4-beta-mannosidase 1-like isoform X2 [Phoenix dactylifera]|uniref:mannan endo-1,4-beta-mannosidase n=1 Tax=Phoenix dactylifera TaxID=42345 RepID=A0A8B7CJU5_PHODC|nr:mannan endo-1,4-beta-mannosidase 1-like isoform X2 [Phoenix dactylifera]